MKIEFGSHRLYMRWQWWHNYLAEYEHITLNMIAADRMNGLVRSSQFPRSFAYGDWSLSDIRQAWNFARRRW
jgi:hypothetical protein